MHLFVLLFLSSRCLSVRAGLFGYFVRAAKVKTGGPVLDVLG